MAKSDQQISSAKKKTYFGLAATFLIGIIFTIITTIPGPWEEWASDRKEKHDAKK